jgi:hypothetical protein
MDKEVSTTIEDYFKIITEYNDDDEYTLAFSTIKEVGKINKITIYLKKRKYLKTK